MESIVDLCPSRVSIGDIKRPADHEGLACTPLWVVGGIAFDDLQGRWVELADYNISCILIGGIHSPKPTFVHHKVNVGVTTPGIVVTVVVAGVIQLTGLADGGCLKVEFDDGVALELIEVDGAVVDHLSCARPGVRKSM